MCVVLPISPADISSNCCRFVLFPEIHYSDDINLWGEVSDISQTKVVHVFWPLPLSNMEFLFCWCPWPVSCTVKKVILSSQQHFDITDPEGESLVPNKYDLCHDKGTYDAVSLCPDNPSSKRELYKKAIHSMTNQDGIFLITSCNWTREELVEQFSECKLYVFSCLLYIV